MIEQSDARGREASGNGGAWLSALPAEPLVVESGWLPISALSSEDMLLTASGELIKPGRITKIAGRHTVYNFEVEGLHTYIAGGYRVHNDSLAIAGAIGQTFGTQLGMLLGGDDTFKQLAYGTVLGAIGKDFARELHLGIKSEDYVFGTQFENFGVQLLGAAAGTISSYLVAEAGEALGLKGFGASLFGATAGAYTGTVLQAAIDAGSAAKLLEGATWSNALDSLPGAIGGFFGSQLANKILPAESVASSIGGAVFGAGGAIAAATVGETIGGVVGNFLLPGIGAFVGTLLGTVIGDIFAGPKEPQAYGHIRYNEETGRFYRYDTDADHHGPRAVADQLGNALADQLNSYMVAIGGIGLDAANDGARVRYTIGYDNADSPYPYSIGPGDNTNGDWNAVDPETALSAGAAYTSQLLKVVGGDIILKRAAAASVELSGSLKHKEIRYSTEVTKVFDVLVGSSLTLAGDMQVAADYISYLENKDTINALIEASPESAFTAGWMITLARAQELGLDKVNKNDFNGGAVGFLSSLHLEQLGASLSDAKVYQLNGALVVEVKVPSDAVVPAVFSKYADAYTNTIVTDANGQSSQVLKFSFNTNGTGVGFVAGTLTSGKTDTTTDQYRSGTVDKSEFIVGDNTKKNTITQTDPTISSPNRDSGVGHDILIGGALADIIQGNAGWDWIDGGAGNDTLSGNGGQDFIRGGDGADSLMGGAGADTLEGGDGADILIGGDAQTVTIWDGDIATPHLLKEVDFATYQGSTAAVTVNLATGTGVGGTAQGDTLSGVEGVIGSKFNDTLTGDGGDNVFEGGAGADSLSGGAGSDTASYASSGAAVTIALGQSVTGGDAQGDVLVSIENLIGTRFADTLTGDANANKLTGGAGNDTLDGGAGADTLAGGIGDDVIIADAADTIVENPGEGFDEVRTSESVTLAAGSEIERLIALGSAAITLKGNEFSNEIFGNAAANALYGLAGSDVLRGGAGADTLDGGHSLNPNGDKDSPTGVDKDVDVASYEGSAQAVQITLSEGATGAGGDAAGDRFYGIEGLIGSALADSLTGDGLDNYFDGGLGADTISGGAGVDIVDYSNSEAAITVSLATGIGTGGSAEGDRLAAIEVLVGSGFADTLMGDANANHLVGGAGNDTLIGGAGADTLEGGDGTDTADYSGSDAALTINLKAGETLHGGTAEGDVLSGIEGIVGSSFADSIVGSNSAESISGGDGNDTIDGGGGNDTLDSGAGDDTVSYASATAAVVVNMGLGAQAQNTVGAGTDILNGFDHLTGSDYNDILIGDAGGNRILGGKGDDTIEGGLASNTLDGGVGVDTVSYAGATAGVTVSLALQGQSQNTVGAGTDILSNFENLTGGAYNDMLIGDGNANTISGGAGNDTINGAAGADSLAGGDGDDVIDGGAGNDTMQGGAGYDTVRYESATAAVTVNLSLTTAQNTGGAGTDVLGGFEHLTGSAYNDTLTGSAENNVISGGAGNDVIDGGAGDDGINGGDGVDTASYGTALAAVTVSLALQNQYQNTIGAGSDYLSGIENLTGGAYNDVLTGDGNANTINGGAGNDLLNGGAGNDSIVGGDGNDTIDGGAGNDTLVSGDGEDTVSYASATAGVTVNLSLSSAQNTVGAGTDTLTGFDHLIGSAYNDTLTGDSAMNYIFGGLGNDSIKGGDRNDTIDGGDGNDTLQSGDGDDTVSYASATAGVTVSLSLSTAQNTGGAGTDTLSGFDHLSGSIYNDTLTGDTGMNAISGGLGNDTLNGAGGNDTLIGGAGDDNLTGGAGNDTFVFAANFGKDVVQDFNAAGAEILSFAAGLFDDFADVMASTTQVGADAIIALDANNTVKLVGVTKTALHDDDFRYA